MLLKVYCRLLAALKSDRGEGPVPYVILVAIMAGVAVAIALGVSGVATTWLTRLQGVSTP
jgi:hypothetical protein